MISNIFDTFSRCRAVILGDINFDLLNLLEDQDERKIMTDILIETKETTLKYLDVIFNSFNIKVYRPQIIKNLNTTFKTPFLNLKSINHCLTPSDHVLFLENSMIEMSSINPNNFFDSIHYKHIFNEFFQNGSRWLSMPRPTYSLDNFDTFIDLKNDEPLADAPAFLPYGDTIFYSSQTVANEKSIQWMKREFPKFNYIKIPNTYGHLDSYLNIIKPGLMFSNIDKSLLPTFFNNWKIVKLEKEKYNDVKFINEFLQDDDYDNTNLSVNIFSIDESNILMNEHTIDQQKDVVKEIEKEKINIIPVKFDTAKWFNQGLSCICNSIVRDGIFQNYK